MSLSRFVLPVFPTCALLTCFPASSPADTVRFKDGVEVQGRVVELGQNSIELLLPSGGSRRIHLRDVEDASFSLEERREASETDVVFRRNGSEVRGTVQRTEQSVIVTRPDGGRIEIPAREVARVIYRDQERASEPAAVYSAKVRDEVKACLARLEAGGEAAREAEAALKAHGIFAIRQVEEALAGARAAASSAAEPLARIVRFYRLRQATPDALQDLRDYYRILLEGTREEKRSLLEEMFTRNAEDCAPVVKFLIRDGREDPVVRAWAVDLLGRMQLNRELVGLFNDPAGGKLQLAAAIAMARNRILLGAQSLIEALEMDDPALREVAIRTLKDAVGQDLGFSTHDTPASRKQAVARWKRWWQENREALEAQAAVILSGSGDAGDSPQRQKALGLWKRGCLAWERRAYAEAERNLRAALQADPTFLNAQVSLGVLLALHVGKGEEGRKVLEDLLVRRPTEMSASETPWIHFCLGEAWEREGDVDQAEAQYRRALALDPRFFRAAAAMADLKFRAATRGERSVSERRQLLKEAMEAYQTAVELIEAQNLSMETLALSDLPVDTAPVFERQEYNRNVLEVKASLRKRKAEMAFGLAKVRSLLKDPRRAVDELTTAIETLGHDREGGARELLVQLHDYRAFLLEELGEVQEALRDYRHVVRDLDARDALALEGLRRLEAKLETAGGAEDTKPRRSSSQARHERAPPSPRARK